MQFILKNLFLIGAVALLTSCAHPAQKWVRKGIIPKKSTYNISINKEQAHDSIRVLYTGCGGLVIFKGHEGLMTDPYYTGHKLWNLKHIKIDPKNDAKVMTRINKIDNSKNIRAAMISHSHYDHLEDLPYLLTKSLLHDSLKIIGDSSTNCTLQPFLKQEHRFIFSDTAAYNSKSTSPVPVKWIQVTDHIRVLAIVSDHAPHYKKIHRMTGNTCRGQKPLSVAEGKSDYRHWLEGKTFSFIVDVMDAANKKPVLRLYIQSSSCLAPRGFPPKAVLDEKVVDVAFLGVASSTYVKPYPEDILNWLNPEKIILVHWEDFFQNLYKKRPKSVRLTKVKAFMRCMRDHYHYSSFRDLSQRFSMPRPLTEIRIRY